MMEKNRGQKGTTCGIGGPGKEEELIEMQNRLSETGSIPEDGALKKVLPREM